jgi:hypothetical protein
VNAEWDDEEDDHDVGGRRRGAGRERKRRRDGHEESYMRPYLPSSGRRGDRSMRPEGYPWESWHSEWGPDPRNRRASEGDREWAGRQRARIPFRGDIRRKWRSDVGSLEAEVGMLTSLKPMLEGLRQSIRARQEVAEEDLHHMDITHGRDHGMSFLRNVVDEAKEEVQEVEILHDCVCQLEINARYKRYSRFPHDR